MTPTPPAAAAAARPYPLLYWSAIGLFIVAGLFIGGAVMAQILSRESFGSFWLCLPGLIALVGAGNALLWRFVLARRNEALTPGERTGRTILQVLLFAVVSMFAVAGLQFAATLLFLYAG
jgi:hypothetical protein